MAGRVCATCARLRCYALRMDPTAEGRKQIPYTLAVPAEMTNIIVRGRYLKVLEDCLFKVSGQKEAESEGKVYME